MVLIGFIYQNFYFLYYSRSHFFQIYSIAVKYRKTITYFFHKLFIKFYELLSIFFKVLHNDNDKKPMHIGGLAQIINIESSIFCNLRNSMAQLWPYNLLKLSYFFFYCFYWNVKSKHLGWRDVNMVLMRIDEPNYKLLMRLWLNRACLVYDDFDLTKCKWSISILEVGVIAIKVHFWRNEKALSDNQS